MYTHKKRSSANKYSCGQKRRTFGTFFEMIITLWVFDTQLKIWYHWRAEIINFFMICFVFWYFHFLWRYWCVYKNSTLFSQTRLIHFDSSNIQKIFFWKLQQKLIFLPRRTFQIYFVMIMIWLFEIRCDFFMLKISHLVTNFIIMWIKKFAPHLKWSKHKHNQKDIKSFSGKNINFCWSFQKKIFFRNLMNRSVVLFMGK